MCCMIGTSEWVRLCFARSCAASLPTGRGQIFEASLLWDESRPCKTDRALTLFADDDFGDAFMLGLRVVILISVNEHDHVSVLFNSTAFAQISVDWAFIWTSLNTRLS